MNHHEQVVELLKFHFQDSHFSGVEIGTACGCLAKSILLYLPNADKIYAIDPYMHNDESLFEANREQEWHDDRKRQAEVALAPYGERATLIADTSNNAVGLVPSVDFVWIDGEHALPQIQKDIENYYSKVKAGGILGGHDYHLAKLVIPNVLQEEVFTGEDLTWWIFKKE